VAFDARPTVAVGDWVAITSGAIEAIVARWSALSRQDPSGAGIQVLAANVDVVMIVAPADRLNPTRVERELAIAWESGARPIVVLTKADVAGSSAYRVLEERLVGVEVLAVSARSGEGVDVVASRLRPDQTGVLLGPSGAGKSTLANALLGADRLLTGAVRDHDHRGRHTTTSRQLVALPGGGVLIDTPGIRSLGLVGDPVALVFPDIDDLASACRYADCRHEEEPGCAVAAALARGDLAADRFASFKKLEAAAAEELARSEVRDVDAQRRSTAKIRRQRLRSADASDRRDAR
jgi:ribosome biogenesis GTPase